MHDLESICASIAAIEAKKQAWEGLWQELADVCHPRRGLVNENANAADLTPDRSSLSRNFDGTAMRANRTLAQGQSSRITPMGARWFVLRPPHAQRNSQSALKWYAEVSEIIDKELYASNFYDKAHEHFLDRGAFGTAATEISEGANGNGLHFRSLPIGSYAIEEDNHGNVSTIVRSYRLTPINIAREFSRVTDSIPPSIREKLKDDKAKHIPLLIKHYVTRRSHGDPRKKDAKNKPFLSYHILIEDKHLLRESGYDEFPFPVSRWETWGDTPYGWSPGFAALPEATQASFIQQMKDVLLETAAFPRVLYTSSLKGDIDFKALGLTCWDPQLGDQPPQEWLTAGRFDVAQMGLDEKRRAIDDSFFVPLFNSISRLNKSDLTATEVRAIVSESRELFHPIFAKLTREFLSPLLRRCFAILARQGKFPPPPPEVIQQDNLGYFIPDPDVEYVSTMALALEQSQLANFAEVLQTLAPGVDHGSLKWINWKQVGPLFARYKGLDESIILSQEEIEALIQQEQQAQQQAMQLEAAKAASSMPPELLAQTIDV